MSYLDIVASYNIGIEISARPHLCVISTSIGSWAISKITLDLSSLSTNIRWAHGKECANEISSNSFEMLLVQIMKGMMLDFAIFVFVRIMRSNGS